MPRGAHERPPTDPPTDERPPTATDERPPTRPPTGLIRLHALLPLEESVGEQSDGLRGVSEEDERGYRRDARQGAHQRVRPTPAVVCIGPSNVVSDQSRR